MEDAISHSSLDSAADEFVVVNAEPKLKIANNGDVDDLRSKLSEVLHDDSSPPGSSSGSGDKMSEKIGVTESVAQDVGDPAPVSGSGDDGEKMGKMGPEEAAGPKTDGERNETGTGADNDATVIAPGVDNDVPVIAGHRESLTGSVTTSTSSETSDATVFTGVTYLGSAAVNAPRSEVEINWNMVILHEQSQMAIPVTLSVPCNSKGIVYLLDPSTNTEIASYRIHRILFCARGPTDSAERQCFAFTCNRSDNADASATFQCHVFSCDVQEAVGKILYSFATAFRKLPKGLSPWIPSDAGDENVFRFCLSLEIKEDDGKGTYVTCPRDKHVFKLRCNLQKRTAICVTQVSQGRVLKIERCFGLLLSHGRNVKHSDMNLVEMVSMGTSNDSRCYQIAGHWDPTDPSFQILNTETPKDTRVFLTIAVDLVIAGIQEPVRFLIEAKAKIFPQHERFWYFNKKPHDEQFLLRLKQLETEDLPTLPNMPQYEVVAIESQTEIDRRKAGMILTLSPGKGPSHDVQTPQDMDDESDGDEPLLSGSGAVSKDISDENVLENWHDVLTRWQQNLRQRPRQVQALVRKGVPEALRGEVWQLLAGCHDNADMLESYRILITKESPCEQVIFRDINRTFPAHDYFRETGGVGQDSLFKISKAYSVYDEEVGYCQGLSFLAASLLLHMPEEQAFCVLVKIMFDYGMRDVYKQGFEELHLRFYQLERLMQDMLPELSEHFLDQGLETHMFASQWFLTLFTAKFPLFMVFHILDLFLGEGPEIIFHVSVALLKAAMKDLLTLDFEGCLKYFRVSMPKKYRSEDASMELLHDAVHLKVSAKKMKKYEKEYVIFREQELQQEDPIERIERENKRLIEANMRLEQENDDLAHELVTSKIALRDELDTLEEQCESVSKDLVQTQSLLTDTEEEKRRLEGQSVQLKELCRRELTQAEQEGTRNTAIIAEYKQICSQLSERLEKQQTATREELARIKEQIKTCDSCCQLLSADGQLKKIVAAESPAPDGVDEFSEKDRVIRKLELELAQTKLALVESECRTQDLTHQLNAAITEIQASKSTWLNKTLTSIREVTTAKKDSVLSKKDSI